MLLYEVMTPHPITVRPESDYLAAIALMRAGKFRHLPVIDAEGRLVGLISDRDLAAVRTQEPTQKHMTSGGTLVRVGEIMHTDVITAPPDYPLEEAARLMIERRISSLPVVEDGRLIGILTDIDIFTQFVRILGGGSPTLRLTIQLENKPGHLSALAGRIAAVGGNILSIASSPTGNPERTNFTLRIESAPLDTIRDAILAHPGAEILHVWDCSK
jgi:acetoin utilization protein AcuB